VLMVQSIYMLIFRIVHIGSAVVWVGMVTFIAVFLSPTAAKLGPAASPVMRELVEGRKVTRFIQSVAGTTVLAGLFMYWRDWHTYGTLGNFLSSAFGLSLTVGAVGAISAFVIGNLFVANNVEKIVALGGKIAAGGGPPAPELIAETQRLAGVVRVASRAVLGLLAIAVLGMATARYW
jgi:uncharacterized membrane protein